MKWSNWAEKKIYCKKQQKNRRKIYTFTFTHKTEIDILDPTETATKKKKRDKNAYMDPIHTA